MGQLAAVVQPNALDTSFRRTCPCDEALLPRFSWSTFVSMPQLSDVEVRASR